MDGFEEVSKVPCCERGYGVGHVARNCRNLLEAEWSNVHNKKIGILVLQSQGNESCQ